MTKTEIEAGPKYAWDLELRPDEALIPTYRYTSPEFLRLEFERVWSSVWQLAGREEQIPNAGDFFEYEIGDQSFLVVRGNDAVIRAYHNVCRHRGNRLCSGQGHVPQITCRYHGWTWSIDGKLQKVPDREHYCPINDEAYGLPPAAVGAWGGFLFINPCAEPEQSLADFLGPIPAQLDAYHFEKMTPVYLDATVPLECNWKVALEAFLEAYHVQMIHPQILPFFDDFNIRHEIFETHSRMLMPVGAPSPRLSNVPPQLTFEKFAAQNVDILPLMGRVDDPITQKVVIDRSPAATNGDLKAFLPYGSDGALKLPADRPLRDFLIDLLKRIGEAKGRDYSDLSRDQLIDAWHYSIFPNVVFNIFAGFFTMLRIRPDAANPDRCLFDVCSYVWIPDPEQAAAMRVSHVNYRTVEEGGERIRLILQQDFANAPGMRKGLHSAGIKHITVSKQECRIVKLHQVLDRYIHGGR